MVFQVYERNKKRKIKPRSTKEYEKKPKNDYVDNDGYSDVSRAAQAFAADEEMIEYETKTETYTMPTMSDNNPAYVNTSIVPDKPKKAVKKQTKK